MRPEAYFHILTEQSMAEMRHAALQIGKRDALIHEQARPSARTSGCGSRPNRRGRHGREKTAAMGGFVCSMMRI